MTFRFVGSSLAVGILCAAGCGSSSGGTSLREWVGASTSEIQGGMSDTSHNFAVVICGGATKANGYQCQILCSGALIAPNLVVSARHCVDMVASDTIDCSTSAFGGPLFPANEYFISPDPNIVSELMVNSYQVSQIVTPTPTQFCGNDLSLLILGENVPASVVPVLVTPEIWNPIDSPQYAAKETAIGYGVDAPDDAATNSAGVRRILEDIDIACIPGDPALNCAPVKQSGVATNEFEAGNGPCSGDSGSSAYEQSNFDAGNWLSFGVLSRGGVQGDMCIGSIYTQLYPWQSLIVSTAQQAASLGGYPAPPWTINPNDGSAPDAEALDEASLPDSSGTGVPDAGPPPVPDASRDLPDAAPSLDSGGAAFGRDSGPEVRPDATSGLGDSGSLAPLGSSCTVDSNCSSDVCVSDTGDDGFVCSLACSASATCPVDYECSHGFCFAVPEAKTGSSGGCSIGRAKVALGSSQEAFACAGVALVLAHGRRRRRSHGANR